MKHIMRRRMAALAAPLRAFAKRLRLAECGNAMLITGLAMPVLVGGAGLAVDLSQWYQWKRELQFAVDQAAVAGAYAYSDTATQDSYNTRAAQEFGANLAVVGDVTPIIAIVDYDGGSDNAIEVTASYGRPLPFTGIFLGSATTVQASAWAVWDGGSDQTYTACIIALDPSAGRSLWFNGGPDVTAGCGVASMSTASNAVEVSGGSGDLDLGWVIAAGGITDYWDDDEDTTVMRNVSGLQDPYAGLTPPNNPTARTAPCARNTPPPTASYTITYSVSRRIEEKYYRGANKPQMTLQRTTLISQTSTTETQQSTNSATVGSSDTTTTTASGTDTRHGNGQNAYWDRTDTVTTQTRTVTSVVNNNPGAGSGASTGNLQPGTYSDFDISCDVTLNPGIYVIDGGDFTINAGDSITGNGVMFVLRNGAGLRINGGGSVNLTAMDETQLMAAGVAADEAQRLAGMLIFEDPESEGARNNWNKINGNSSTYLNGAVYLPVSEIEFGGTAGVTSRCLTIAAARIQISGNADISTFCPPGMQNDAEVLTSGTGVRLVR